MDILKRNHVTKYGAGELVLLFGHGFGASQEMWRLVAPAFQEKYTVVLFDYVGSGQSDISAYQSEKYSDLEGYKKDLLEVIEAIGASSVTFIGHSVSSMIGMLAAIEKPQWFDRLIMIGPSPRYINEQSYTGGFEITDVDELLAMMEMNFLGWASYLAPIAVNQENDEKVAQELKKSFISTDVQVMNEFAKATFYSDYRHLLKDFQTPTLIMQCSDDSIVPEAVGLYLANQIPNADYVKMDAKGHYPQLSHPLETIQHIQDYLDLDLENA